VLAPRPSPGWRNGVPPQHNHCRLGTDPLGLFNWFNGKCPPSSILINLASVLWQLNHATFNFRAYDFMLIHLQLNNGEQIHTLTSQALSFLGVLVSGIKGVLDVSSGMQAISNVRGKGDHRGPTLPVSLFAETGSSSVCRSYLNRSLPLFLSCSAQLLSAIGPGFITFPLGTPTVPVE
jgi:hypothetical protein